MIGSITKSIQRHIQQGVSSRNERILREAGAEIREQKEAEASRIRQHSGTGLEDLIAMIADAGVFSDPDLAMVVLGEQIRMRNEGIRSKIQAIRNTSAASKALGGRINELRQLQTRIRSMNNDDNDRDDNHRYAASEIANASMSAPEIEEIQAVRRFDIDPNTGELNVTKTGKYLGHEDYKVSAASLDARIKELQGQQQQLSENSELMSLGLQDLMGKKTNLIEMATNMMKKKDSRQQRIIGNLL